MSCARTDGTAYETQLDFAAHTDPYSLTLETTPYPRPGYGATYTPPWVAPPRAPR